MVPLDPNPSRSASGTRGISRDDVWQAADALLVAGQRPTIERIRQHLGRGSPNTVSPHLDAWFAALGGRLKDAQSFMPRPDFPDPVGQAARYLWEVALSHAQSAAEASLAEREAALRQAQAELAEEREALAREREVLQARLEGAESAMAALAAARDESAERALRAEAELGARQAGIDALRASLATAQQEKDGLRREADAQRAAWDQERELLNTRAGANERRLALELDAARVAAREGQKQLDAERKAALERLAHAAELATRQGGEMQKLGASIAVLEERIRERERLLAEYKAQSETAPARPTTPVPKRRRFATSGPAPVRTGRLRTRAP